MHRLATDDGTAVFVSWFTCPQRSIQHHHIPQLHVFGGKLPENPTALDLLGVCSGFPPAYAFRGLQWANSSLTLLEVVPEAQFRCWLVPQVMGYQTIQTSVRNRKKAWFVSLLQTLRILQSLCSLKIEVFTENKGVGPQHNGSSFSCPWFQRHASRASNYYHVWMRAPAI